MSRSITEKSWQTYEDSVFVEEELHDGQDNDAHNAKAIITAFTATALTTSVVQRQCLLGGSPVSFPGPLPEKVTDRSGRCISTASPESYP
jgi:hypothetical protein